MQDNQKDKLEKVSDEKISNVSGGSVSMIYKKRLRYYVWDPHGNLNDKFWFQQSALNRAAELSKSSPGNESGALRIINDEEYEKKVKQGTIQKIV
jgi:hypothetical protein